MNNTPSKEELWLLCLKGKCANVNDTGLEYLQASFKEFVKNLLVICCTVAAHESRTTILCRDVIHSQEILFRQRENSTIRMSGKQCLPT
jgi:histone H3/H4